MAPLPKRRHSTHRSGRRRSADILNKNTASICRQCGATKRAHTACQKCGFYKKNQVISIKTNEEIN